MHRGTISEGPTRVLTETQPVVATPTSLSPASTESGMRAAPNHAYDAEKLHGEVPRYADSDNGPAPRKFTQEDQNVVDAKAQKRAMDELVNSWMERLQQMSIITTFFAAMETQLVGSTLPLVNPTRSTYVNQIANAALTGALVMHVFAAILSFFAAFFLIRYKLAIAKRKTDDVEAGMADGPPGSRTATSGQPASMDPGLPGIFSSNPHLEQVGPFRRGEAPTHLLDHCHTVCMWLAGLGFLLALAGVVCFAWSRLALSGAIFSSACMLVCLVISLGAFCWPAGAAHERR